MYLIIKYVWVILNCDLCVLERKKIHHQSAQCIAKDLELSFIKMYHKKTISADVFIMILGSEINYDSRCIIIITFYIHNIKVIITHVGHVVIRLKAVKSKIVFIWLNNNCQNLVNSTSEIVLTVQSRLFMSVKWWQ